MELSMKTRASSHSWARASNCPLPDTSLTPSHITIVDCGSGAIPFRQVAPRRSAAQDIEDAVENSTVVSSLKVELGASVSLFSSLAVPLHSFSISKQ